MGHFKYLSLESYEAHFQTQGIDSLADTTVLTFWRCVSLGAARTPHLHILLQVPL